MVSHLKEMTKNIKVLMDQYVQMAKHDEMAVKGFSLRRKMMRSFTDEGEGMRLIRESWGEDALADATHVSLPDLEKVLAKRLGTAKDAKEAVKRVLNPVLKFKTSEAYLEESRSL
jgi:hypothetical protein